MSVKFWVENYFGRNEISGLKILGPKKFGSEKIFGFKKKLRKKNWRAKLILGTEIILKTNCANKPFKKCWVQKNFGTEKQF